MDSFTLLELRSLENKVNPVIVLMMLRTMENKVNSVIVPVFTLMRVANIPTWHSLFYLNYLSKMKF